MKSGNPVVVEMINCEWMIRGGERNILVEGMKGQGGIVIDVSGGPECDYQEFDILSEILFIEGR